jgi:hypothetical protein
MQPKLQWKMEEELLLIGMTDLGVSGLVQGRGLQI